MERYDFRAAQRLSRDQLRVLARVNKALGRSISTLLAQRVREEVNVEAGEVQQMTYSQFTQAISHPALFAIYDVQPLNQRVILHFDLALVFFVYDRLCGGPGESKLAPRELTDLETKVISRQLVEPLRESLARGWENVAALTFRVLQMESNPLYLIPALDQDQVVVVEFETRVGQRAKTGFRLCLPYELVERLVPKSPHRSHVEFQRTPSEAERRILVDEVGMAPVKLEAILGTTVVTVEQLLQLQPGDTVVLDQRTDRPIQLRVAGVPKFEGMPGRLGDRLGVRITGLVEPEPEL